MSTKKKPKTKQRNQKQTGNPKPHSRRLPPSPETPSGNPYPRPPAIAPATATATSTQQRCVTLGRPCFPLLFLPGFASLLVGSTCVRWPPAPVTVADFSFLLAPPFLFFVSFIEEHFWDRFRVVWSCFGSTV